MQSSLLFLFSYLNQQNDRRNYQSNSQFVDCYCCCSSFSAFQSASQFNSDLSTWDVSRVTSMTHSKCSHQILSFSFPFNQAKLTFNNCFFFFFSSTISCIFIQSNLVQLQMAKFTHYFRRRCWNWWWAIIMLQFWIVLQLKSKSLQKMWFRPVQQPYWCD